MILSGLVSLCDVLLSFFPSSLKRCVRPYYFSDAVILRVIPGGDLQSPCTTAALTDESPRQLQPADHFPRCFKVISLLIFAWTIITLIFFKLSLCYQYIPQACSFNWRKPVLCLHSGCSLLERVNYSEVCESSAVNLTLKTKDHQTPDFLAHISLHQPSVLYFSSRFLALL